MNIKLHKIFNSMQRLRWDEIKKINFKNGIYIIFEDGETYHGMDRIVRVGTHNSDGRLCTRLKEHFISKHKDGSIFRKNVGKAILNKEQSPYLKIWDKNSSNRKLMTGVVGYDPTLQRSIEIIVTEYMCKYFSFVCFPVESKARRLRLEEGVIATLNGSPDFFPSPDWLGNYSPESEISRSGMWLKRGLNGVLLSDIEFNAIEKFCETVLLEKR